MMAVHHTGDVKHRLLDDAATGALQDLDGDGHITTEEVCTKCSAMDQSRLQNSCTFERVECFTSWKANPCPTC